MSQDYNRGFAVGWLSFAAPLFAMTEKLPVEWRIIGVLSCFIVIALCIFRRAKTNIEHIEITEC